MTLSDWRPTDDAANARSNATRPAVLQLHYANCEILAVLVNCFHFNLTYDLHHCVAQLSNKLYHTTEWLPPLQHVGGEY